MADLVLISFQALTVLLLVGLNAFFVAAEFALVTVRWTRVDQLAAQNRFGAGPLKSAVEKLDDSLAAAQVGITFASLALGWVGEPMVAAAFRPWFAALPEVWGIGLTHLAAITVSFLLITYLHVVLGEQVPKVIAIDRAEDVGLLIALPLTVFARIVRPFVAVIRSSSNFVIRQLRLPEPTPSKLVHSVEELRMLVEETEEAGVLPTDQASYLENVFRLSDKQVRDVMVPREKVVTVSLDASEEAVLETARQTAHTRLPVWHGVVDDIVGIVNTKDLFHLFSLQGLVILEDAMYPALFVHPDQPVSRLLRTFRREKRQMAVVQNDDGRFLGIVTLEDILEEIVGEIQDEHDESLPAAKAATQAARTIAAAKAEFESLAQRPAPHESKSSSGSGNPAAPESR